MSLDLGFVGRGFDSTSWVFWGDGQSFLKLGFVSGVVVVLL